MTVRDTIGNLVAIETSACQVRDYLVALAALDGDTTNISETEIEVAKGTLSFEALKEVRKLLALIHCND